MKEVHGRKIVSLCKKFHKDLIRWESTSGVLSLPTASNVSIDSSISSNVIVIESNTILDFCRPDSSDG